MPRLKRICYLSVMVCLVSLFGFSSAVASTLAIPSLPSSFYGTVKVNGSNVPDGTVIQALINGIVYAEGRSQTYQSDSVYSLDVPGDKTETTVQDGGREGDVVQFKIGGLLAAQSGVWKSGTNVALNLSASSPNTLEAPPPLPRPVPTQTAIPVVIPSPQSTESVPSSPTPTAIVQASSVPQKPAAASSAPAQLPQPTQAPGSIPTSPGQKESGGAGLATIVIILIILGAAGTFWFLRRNK